MSTTERTQRKRKARYRRARIRNFLFTVGPARLTGGSISRRHLSRDFAVNEIETVSPAWPAGLDGLRIGHVSDFHIGDLIKLERGLEAIELLAAQEPDIVACTGDIVDLQHVDAPPLLEALANIPAPLGCVLVLGNHDELHCPDTIIAMAKDAGLHVLQNEAMAIGWNGARLVVAGIGWAQSAVACARRVDAIAGTAPDLLLSHNPKAFLRAADVGIPLTLAGHTHGGQIAVKNRPNANLALTHRHRAGMFSHGSSRLFVTTGVGSWFPLRVNCPAEVAVVTMRSSASGVPELSPPL